MRRLFALTAALLLAACGGGGGSPEAAPVSAPAAVDALPALPALRFDASCVSTGRTVRIQLFGDSTQAGALKVGYSDKPPAALLQADLDALFGAGSVLVEARAVGSTTSLQLVEGTDGMNQPWPASVRADIVVVNHGINDMTRGYPVDEYAARLRFMAKTAGAAVVFQTQNPTDQWDGAPRAEAMRKVAAEVGATVADTFAFVHALPGEPTQFLADWAHPTQPLYEHIVRGSLLPAVLPIVRGLRCKA